MKKKTLKTYARFLESQTDPEGKDWDVCILEEGTSKNGFTYTGKLLEQSAPLFEGAKACLYEFSDKILRHLPNMVQDKIREGFPRSIVGWYSDVHYGSFKDNKGIEHKGLLGKFHISENAKWLRELMKDAWAHGKSLLGLSIDANATVCESEEGGRLQKIVQEILGVNSVDVVSYPSAGGEFLRLVASLDESDEPLNLQWEDGMKKYLSKLFEMVFGKNPEAVKGMDPKNITEAQGATLFTEAMKIDVKETLNIVESCIKEAAAEEIAAQKKKDDEKAMADKQAACAKEAEDKTAKDKGLKESADVQKVQEGVKVAEKIKEDILKLNCASLLSSMLSASQLPVPVQEDISERFAGRIFEAKELEATITKSKDVLAKLSESGEVRLMGKKSIEVTLMESDKKQAALDKLIDPLAVLADKVKGVGAFRGIKEAYVAYTGDHSVSGHVEKRRLTEEMQSSDFSYALGTSMTRKLAKEYPALPTTWQNVANVVPLSNFKTQETIRWGGFGRLPVVAEKGSYTDLSGPRDERATYSPSKKGGLAYITREMIMNDDLRMLQRLPSSLARAAAETLEYYVWNPILANSTCYDLTALGSVAHGNYGTSALDSATLTAAKLRMRKQAGQGSVLYAGTASTTGSTTTLVDATLSQFAGTTCVGKYLRIIAGTGAGTRTLISSHNTTTLTFAEIASTPDSTSVYQVSAASADDVLLGLRAKYLICGPDLEATGNILLQSDRAPGGNNNDVNVHKGTLEILSPLHLTDVNNWFLSADPALIDLVEVGFIDGQSVPTLLLQDQPQNGVVFTNDQIVYKVRHEYGIVVPDYRGWDLNIVA